MSSAYQCFHCRAVVPAGMNHNCSRTNETTAEECGAHGPPNGWLCRETKGHSDQHVYRPDILDCALFNRAEQLRPTAPVEGLKPCPVPWCGKPAHKNVCSTAGQAPYVVRCSKCLLLGPRCPTEAEAIAAWNTRAEQPRPTEADPFRMGPPPEGVPSYWPDENGVLQRTDRPTEAPTLHKPQTSPDASSGKAMADAGLADALINWRANRPLSRAEVEGVCQTPDLCWEYNDWVRCGPCALTTGADGVAAENEAQRLQDHMEQRHGVCLSASEWDAAVCAIRARMGDG